MEINTNNNKTSTFWKSLETGNEKPTERYGQTSCYIETLDRMYIFGGCEADGSFSNSLFYFDFKEKLWIDLSPPKKEKDEKKEVEPEWPKGRHFHTAVVFREKMYIFAGKSNGYMNDLCCFDPVKGNWEIKKNIKGEPPSKRYGHSAVIFNDYMYTYGGYDDFGLKCNDLYHYSFSKNEWIKIRTLGSSPDLFHHIGIVYEGSMYLFGGYGEDTNLYDYRFDNNTWSTVKCSGEVPSLRWGHKTVIFRNKLYLIGGADKLLSYNDCYVFKFETNKWKRHKLSAKKNEEEIFPKRYFHSVCIRSLTDELIVFGGKNIHNYAFNDLCSMTLNLKGKNEPNRFLKDFANILNQPNFADVIFTFKNEPKKQFTSHRNILFVRCPKMRTLISKEKEIQNETGSYYKIEIEDFSSSTFFHFLKFIYNGSIPAIDEIEIPVFFELIRISLHFSMQNCAFLCEDFIEQQIVLKNVIPVYEKTLSCSPKLQRVCLSLIIKNFSSLKEQLKETLVKNDYKFIKQIYKRVI